MKDPETGETYLPQSTYGDYMPYWENNVNVGTARVVLKGYSDGPIYGTTTLTFDIVPTNVTEEDFSYTTTTNSVHLSWEPSMGATHYIVYQNIGGTWTRLGIVDQRNTISRNTQSPAWARGATSSASGPLHGGRPGLLFHQEFRHCHCRGGGRPPQL